MTPQEQMASISASIQTVATLAGVAIDVPTARSMGERAYNELMAAVKSTLTAGNPIDLYGICQFSIVPHAAHTAYKSTTGEPYTVAPYRTVKVTVEKALKTAVKAVPA